MAEERDTKAKPKRGPAKKDAPKKPAAAKKPAGAAAAKKAPAKPKATAKKPVAKREPKAETKAPATPTVRASARYLRVAPRKARMVADQIRGLPIEDARALLQFSPRGAAGELAKLLESAAANAENNHDLIADEMRVAQIRVDEGPTLRRFRPRALGRATRINKRTSHVSLELQPKEPVS
jgi:large subunit ribosomal protein L22